MLCDGVSVMAGGCGRGGIVVVCSVRNREEVEKQRVRAEVQLGELHM